MAGVTRLLHKRGSNGERIVGLDHLEHRVWVQYVLSADDYGVMRASASVLRADNRKLELEPLKRLEKAMAGVVASTLVRTFTHQTSVYWWQDDWQDFQMVQYPKDTIHPAPPAEMLATATAATRKLFAVHDLSSKDRQAKLREKSFGTVAEVFVESSDKVPAHVRGRETHTHTQTQTHTPSRSGSSEESSRETALVPSQPVRLSRPRPLMGPHLGCFFAPEACARGACLPAWLGNEWVQQFADPAEGQREVAATVKDALARLPDGPIGDQPRDFWRGVWRARHGSAVAKPGSRTGDTVDAGREFMADRLATLARGGE